MIRKIFKKYFFVICFISCEESVDFNQFDDIELSPIHEVSLIFFDAPANEFFIGGVEVSEASDFIETNIFEGNFLQDNLVRSEFVFEITNSINRGYQVQVDFLNIQGQIEHTTLFSSDASPNNTAVFTKFTEVFDGSSLRALKRTVRLNFKLTMLPGVAINDSTPGRINLQSKGIFYFNI